MKELLGILKIVELRVFAWLIGGKKKDEGKSIDAKSVQLKILQERIYDGCSFSPLKDHDPDGNRNRNQLQLGCRTERYLHEKLMRARSSEHFCACRGTWGERCNPVGSKVAPVAHITD